MKYEIEFSPEFDKQFSSLPKNIQVSLLRKVKILEDYPRYGEMLTGRLKSLLDLKLGKYRIIYKIFEEKKLVRVVTIGLRKKVYKELERKDIENM